MANTIAERLRSIADRIERYGVDEETIEYDFVIVDEEETERQSPRRLRIVWRYET
jgi:hypothetical protein